VVRRIVPPEPTAVPILTSVNETPSKLTDAPLICEVQLVPPSVVRRIVPASPTAHPVLVLTKSTE
jgi:hypothetical protein